MPLPSNPSNNQTFTLNGVTYQYNSAKDTWRRIDAAYVVGGSGIASANLAITSDTFTGNGVQTQFVLSSTPSNIDNTLVNLNGVTQIRGNAYSLAGNTVTLAVAPAANDLVEITVTEITAGATVIGPIGYTGSSGIGYTGSAGTVTGYTGSAGGAAINGNFYVSGDTVISGNITPDANVAYSLGSTTHRFKDLYLSGNTLYLGNQTFSAQDIFPFNLDIQPEVLTIQVQSNFAGDTVEWQWTWLQSTLPYARASITNQFQLSVPLYNQGTYQINNFAGYQTFGNMTQVHLGYFKWIEGAGTQNLVSWASTYTTANISHPDINSGNVTQVQRYSFQVPSTITLPNLVAPTITYDVSVANMQYQFGGDSGIGYNINLGPVYRGGTYTFNLAASLAGHPFYLTTDNGTNFVANSYVGEYLNGVTGSRNNGSSGQTTLVFQVPQNAPDTLYYQCGVHASMRGAITIKNLAVEQNVNGNYVIYFQHTHEGHRTPIEIRPIPSLVNQMCVVYDQNSGRFVPQDLATYVENTPSFKNKIREVAGTATLIAPNGVAVVPTVLVVEDASYLPLVNNKEGDIAFDSYFDTLYIWNNGAWRSTKSNAVNGFTGSIGYTGSQGTGYTGSQGSLGFTGSSGVVGYTGSIGIGYTGSVGTFSGTTAQQIITSNTMPTTSTNSGALVVGGGAGIQGNVVVGGEIFISGNIIPFANEISNLGSPDKRFKTLYIAANTIDMGGSKITTDAGSLQFNTSSGNVVLNSNAVSFLSNVTTGNPAGVFVGVINLHQQDTLTVLTGTARWYAPYNLKINTITARLGTVANNYVEARINKNDQLLFTANIAPSANNVTSSNTSTLVSGDYLTVDVTKIGTAPNQGKDLYIQIKYTYEA